MPSEIRVTLPDGSEKRVPAGSTGADLAKAIGPGLAKAAIALRSRFPEVAAMATVPAITLPASATHHALKLYNLNELIRTYPGATGLKTGWTGRAGGCLIATATRDGRHLLTVVLGSPRLFDEAATLLDYGFASPPGV